MRTSLVRGALVAFFTVTGLFGTAASVHFDGMSATVESNSASAEIVGGCVFKWGQKMDPDCELRPFPGRPSRLP